MKRNIIIICLLMALGLAFAQSPVSLRHYTLGAVMDGEWEQIYDPIDLNYYTQTYYFTNLSDYIQHVTVFNGDEQFVDESKFLSEYPFGFTFLNPFDQAIKHAILVRFKDNQTPNLGNGYGVNETVQTNYYDTNDDYIYDLKQFTILKQTDYTDMADKFYLLLNTSIPMGEDIFGFRISYDKDCQKWDESSIYVDAFGFSSLLNGFNAGDIGEYRYFNSYDLENDLTTLEFSEEGKFETTSSNSVLNLLASYQQPSDLLGGNSELRYDLNLTFDSMGRDETNDTYTGDFFRVWDVNTTEEGVMDQTYDRVLRMPRNELFAGIKLRKNIDSIKPRYKQSFMEFGIGIGGFGGDYEDNITGVYTTDITYIDTTAVDMQQWETINQVERYDNSGSYIGFRTNLHARSGVAFSEYVNFGYGVNLDIQTFQRKSDNDSEYNYENVFQLGTAFDDINDVRMTNNALYSYKQELAQTNLVTTLPVGLEFSLPKTALTDHDSFSLRNFTFRIGTIFTHNIEYRDYMKSLNNVELSTTITELGDGTITETHSSDFESINNHSESTSADGFKRFTAGLGYEHSDFLNIDVGGHVDSNGEDYFIGAMFTVKK